MRFWIRFSRGDLRLTRVQAFSDQVLAIVVTLPSHRIGAASAWLSAHAAFAIHLPTPPFYIVPPAPRPSASLDS